MGRSLAAGELLCRELPRGRVPGLARWFRGRRPLVPLRVWVPGPGGAALQPDAQERVSVRTGARPVRGIVWRGHVHPSPTGAARTAQQRGRVGARVRGEPGPAWGGSFPPRSLRRGSLQPRRLSLRGDLRVVPRRGRLRKFGFAQRNLQRLRKVARSLHEGVGPCCFVRKLRKVRT